MATIRIGAVAAMAMLLPLAAQAAVVAPAATSGTSADGTLGWVSSQTGVTATTNARAMALGATSSKSTSQALTDPNGDTITTTPATSGGTTGYAGFLSAGDPGNGGINNPNGVGTTKVPIYFANTTSKTIDATIDTKFGTPERYFSALVTNNNANATYSFYSGTTLVMSLSAATIGYFNSSTNYYSTYLTVSSLTGATFDRLLVDMGPAAATATFGDGGFGNAMESTTSNVVASVPEPSLLGLAGSLALLVAGCMATTRRRNPPLAG